MFERMLQPVAQTHSLYRGFVIRWAFGFRTRSRIQSGPAAAGAACKPKNKRHAGPSRDRCNTLLKLAWLLLTAPAAPAAVVFETTSPYHHIRVVDQGGFRVLSFDGSMETRMSLRNPLLGQFEYVDYFHLPWLWNDRMKNVLMIGLGGGSIQRGYTHYYPHVKVETVEIDPVVIQVASNYFGVKESARLKIHNADGRAHLRRSQAEYDAIIVDAYVKNRYGSFIPHHLATREFLQLASDHLTGEGVVAYNVIGSLQGWRADILGAVYKTMKSVFPEVYVFPATETLNVVLIGTKSSEKLTPVQLQQRASQRVMESRVTFPAFRARAAAASATPPPTAARSPILTDDFAPVDGLLRGAAP